MAAGVGKTFRMLQEGRQAQEHGRDVVIGYLEPHDRPETAVLAEGLEAVPRLRTSHGELELDEMDLDAVIERRPELALVDELAHTNAAATRNERRYQDIDELLDAGIDVVSTVNIQHLESLNDAIYELTGVRVRRRSPTGSSTRRTRSCSSTSHPSSCRNGCAKGRSIRRSARRSRCRTSSGRRTSARCASSCSVSSQRTSRRAVGRPSLEPLSKQAVAERILALIEPQPKSQRILRRAWRSSQRLGAEIDALWVRPAHYEPSEEEATQLAALRRLASILGIHFLEADGDDLVAAVRTVAAELGSTYVFVGTPDERRRTEILRGSLLSRMVRELPGLDIRVIADRAKKEAQPE